MAVNVKYRHEYKPTQSGHYIINLCDKNFTGSATDIEMASTPFTLNWQNDDPHAYIVSSECSMNFICETQAQVDWFTDVASSPTGTYTVEILKGGTNDLYWCGVIQAESVTIPYLTPPLVINVQANDDLARLADSFHNQTGLEGGTPYATGGQMGHVHLRRALSRIRTFHHWENQDYFLEFIEYYETASNGHGITQLMTLTESWDTTEEGGDNSAVTDLDVLEQFCMAYNCRLLLEGGMFKMHNLSMFETAVNYEADVRYMRKSGVVFISQPTPDLETPFTDIQKYGGWSTTFVPALKSVRLKSSGGFFAPWGGVSFIPHQNQWLGYTGNHLNTDNYNNDTGGSPLFPGNIPGGTSYMVLNQAEAGLLQIHPQVGFDPFTLNNGNDVDNVIRVKCTILLRGELLGPGQNNADRWATRTATFDNAATQPILMETGGSLEVASVEYSDVTWTTTSTARLVWYSQPIDCSGNQNRAVFEPVNIVLPAYDSSSSGVYIMPNVGGRIDVVKHDGTALSSADQTTVDNAFNIGVFAGPRVFSSAAGNQISEDSQQAQFSATQQTSDFRENLDMGTTHFGLGANSPAYFMAPGGGTQFDFTSPGNTDGTDWILQLIVKDVLRLRSLPRKLFTGNGIKDTTHTFSFSRIYTDNGTRYALIGASLDGATNITSVTFFELQRDNAVTISDTDIKDVVPGTVVPVGGGEVDNDNDSGSNFEHWFEAVGSEQSTSNDEITVSRLPKKEERRMIRQRIRENGMMIARALEENDTSTPVFAVYKPNAVGNPSRDFQAIKANAAGGQNDIIALPALPATDGQYIMMFDKKGSGNAEWVARAMFDSSNVGNVLTVVATTGGGYDLGWSRPTAAAGGFYAINGIANFAGARGGLFLTLHGDSAVTSATDAQGIFVAPADGAVGEFSIFCGGTTSNATLELYRNGTRTEQESVTFGTGTVHVGTFSTSGVRAGDRLQFFYTPTRVPRKITMTVKYTPR